MFELLEVYPFTFVTSLIGILLVMSFFVTSSDSGSLVVDHLTSGGKLDSPVPQRVFWAIMEGAVAGILLLGGGLVALQSAAVASGLLFAVVLLIAIWSMRRAFGHELRFLEAGIAVPEKAHVAAAVGAHMQEQERAAEEARLERLRAEHEARGGDTGGGH
jgi:choline/glycine/proline betaine transport protein